MGSRAPVAWVGACALLLAACGGIPSSGPPVAAGPASNDDPPPHIIGTRAGPQQGATPAEILEGFIAAMEFYESPRGYPTAEEFLTEEAAANWEEPLSEIVIYNDEPVIEIDGNVATLTVSVEATYDRTDGFVRRPSSADPMSFTFDLERVAGEWRLASAPEGLLIQESAFVNDFQAYNLYFYNEVFDTNTMVPDPVYLPRTASNLETLLVKELLAGPSEWLAPAVVSAFPEGTVLEPEAVPVDNGDARVTLGQTALETDDGAPTSPEERQLMVHQLVRTLGEQPTVDRVSVTGPGATRMSGTDANPYVDVEEPAAPGLARRVYTVTDSGVGWLVEGSSPAEVTAVTGPLGDYPGLQEVAVDRRHQRAAAVNENDELILADLNTGNEVTALYPTGGAFGSLAWDGSGLLWAIERERKPAANSGDGSADGAAGQRAEGDSGNRLLVIDPETGDVADVTPPTKGDAEIEQMAIAPDGVRIAFVIGGQVHEAIVVRDPDRPVDPKMIEVRGLRQLHIEGVTEPAADVAWHGGDELALLTVPETRDNEPVEPGSPDGQKLAEPRAHVVALSELAVDSTRGIADGISIAAPTAGNRLAVGTSDDVVWIRSSTVRWIPLENATAPAFAG